MTPVLELREGRWIITTRPMERAPPPLPRRSGLVLLRSAEPPGLAWPLVAMALACCAVAVLGLAAILLFGNACPAPAEPPALRHYDPLG